MVVLILGCDSAFGYIISLCQKHPMRYCGFIPQTKHARATLHLYLSDTAVSIHAMTLQTIPAAAVLCDDQLKCNAEHDANYMNKMNNMCENQLFHDKFTSQTNNILYLLSSEGTNNYNIFSQIHKRNHQISYF